MIDPAWIPVVAAASGAAIAFIGGLIGAGIGYLNTRQQLNYQARQEQRKLHAEKLDEIMSALVEIMRVTYGELRRLRTKENHITLNDEVLVRTKSVVRVLFLAQVYFPDLMPRCEALMECHNNQEKLEVKLLGQRGKDLSDEMMKEMENSLDKLAKACDSIVNQAPKLAQKYLVK